MPDNFLISWTIHISWSYEPESVTRPNCKQSSFVNHWKSKADILLCKSSPKCKYRWIYFVWYRWPALWKYGVICFTTAICNFQSEVHSAFINRSISKTYWRCWGHNFDVLSYLSRSSLNFFKQVDGMVQINALIIICNFNFQVAFTKFI